MSRIIWDEAGKHLYETGAKNGVFYPFENGVYSGGVPWNGVTAFNSKPSGAEANKLYADDIKYLNLVSAEDYGATLEAYTYPPEFADYDGSAEIAPGVRIGQQVRKSFGFCVRTTIGNDILGADYGYKLHLVYGILAAPSERNYSTINENPDAITMSWEFSTTPVAVAGYKPTAHVEIDSTKTDPAKLAALLDILYGKDPTTPGGNDGVEPRLPLPDEIAALVGNAG